MAKVQVIERTLEILELLALEPDGLGVTEIGERVMMHKSTVHRILSTLMYWGYTEKNSMDKYRLGLKIISIGSIFLNNIELKTEALPYMRDLVDKSKQTVHLAILEEGYIVYIEKVDVTNNIRMYSQIGKRVSFHSTALGKTLVAHLNLSEIEDMINTRSLSKVTKNTIFEKGELIKELRKVKKQGYALDDEENELGIRCIAAPIYDYRGKVIAAISTSGSAEVFTYERIKELKEFVLESGNNISKRMGYNL